MSKHDDNAVAGLLSDNFQATSSTGRKGGKSTLLREIRRDRNVYDSARAQSMQIRSLGPDVAVVSGIISETGTTPEGSRFKSSRRFTDRWQLENGRWRCVASEASRLP